MVSFAIFIFSGSISDPPANSFHFFIDNIIIRPCLIQNHNEAICYGESITLTAENVVDADPLHPPVYLWSPSTGLSCTNCQNTIASPVTTTTSTITWVTNENANSSIRYGTSSTNLNLNFSNSSFVLNQMKTK